MVNRICSSYKVILILEMLNTLPFVVITERI